MSIFHVIVIFFPEHATVTILNAKDGVLGNDKRLYKRLTNKSKCKKLKRNLESEPMYILKQMFWLALFFQAIAINMGRDFVY